MTCGLGLGLGFALLGLGLGLGLVTFGLGLGLDVCGLVNITAKYLLRLVVKAGFSLLWVAGNTV